jgi:hypothetical protein
MAVVPNTCEAEVEELLEPRSSRPEGEKKDSMTVKL